MPCPHKAAVISSVYRSTLQLRTIISFSNQLAATFFVSLPRKFHHSALDPGTESIVKNSSN
jgi:hypothetical protein